MRISTTIAVLSITLLVLVVAALPGAAQDVAAPAVGEPDAPVVTERDAFPYSIDLLPDDPAPTTFEEAPGATAGAAATGPGTRAVTGDLFDRWFSTKESGITFGGRVTQFAFGLAGGIDQPVPPPLGQGDVFKYTGRGAAHRTSRDRRRRRIRCGRCT